MHKIGLIWTIFTLLLVFVFSVEKSLAYTWSGGGTLGAASTSSVHNTSSNTTSSNFSSNSTPVVLPPISYNSSGSTVSPTSTTRTNVMSIPNPLNVRVLEVQTPVEVLGSVGVYNVENIPLATSLQEAKPGTTFTKDELYLNVYQSDIWLTSAMVALVALAQFLIMLIFLIRIVVLWILLILSPFLLVLALIFFSKSLFKTWGWVYLRWILIGPLLAMGIGIVVHIWSVTGVPIYSTAEVAQMVSGDATNLILKAPYQAGAETLLETNHDFMPLLVAVIMLYVVIFLPFLLTHKTVLAVLSEKSASDFRGTKEPKVRITEKQEDSLEKQKPNLLDTFGGKLDNLKLNRFLGSFGKASDSLVGEKKELNVLQNSEKKVTERLESSSPLDSKKFDEMASKLDTPVLVKLAHLDSLTDPRRNQNLKELIEPSRVLNQTRRINLERLNNELHLRAERGDEEAVKIVNEIKQVSDFNVQEQKMEATTIEQISKETIKNEIEETAKKPDLEPLSLGWSSEPEPDVKQSN